MQANIIIKTAIIDDEVKASENIQILLNNFCKAVEIVGVYSTPKDAVVNLKDKDIDLLFLDINMPDMDGFALLETLNKDKLNVIFVTAHGEFAVKAFKVNAVDYLLKPIEIPQLVKAIEKVLNLKKQSLASLTHEAVKKSRLKIPTMEGFVMLSADDILYLKAESNYTHIQFQADSVYKKITSSKTLKYFEDLLESRKFFRVHDSYIVNLTKINKYIKSDSGSVVMMDGSNIYVSRRRKTEFLEALETC